MTTFDAAYAHYAFVVRCLRRFGVGPLDRDDAVQDVFLLVHRYLLRGRKRVDSVRPWLYVVSRWVAQSHRRRARRKQAPLEPLVSEPEHPDPGPLERAEDAQAEAFVATFLAGLDDKKRDLFILALEGLSTPEMADALSITFGAAEGRRSRLRVEFKRALARRVRLAGRATPQPIELISR